MKSIKILLTIGFILATGIIAAQTPYYYYYQGVKQYLNLDRSRVFVSVADTSQFNIARAKTATKFSRDIPVQKQIRAGYTKRYWKEAALQSNLSASQYQSKIASIKQDNANVIVAPYFTNQRGEKIGLSNFLYVKLKELSDTTVLKQQASNYNATVVCQDKFMPLWFVVSVTATSSFNAMELANIWHESGLFQCTEPDLMTEENIDCFNDTYFDSHYYAQWGLNNTAQTGGIAGVDIKACNTSSTGSNIVVAVVDDGIELNHPDLAANIFPQSYDADNNSSPSIVRGGHGTACAGVIGAVRNNNIGIAGVAPNCRLMSVSYYKDSPLANQKSGEGINWAWQHGADVISNSWHTLVQSQIINNAITAAVTQGRYGKGCVLVFSSGNDYASTVCYPANLSNVIAVGAIEHTGWRPSFSNHGTALDVVAPGFYIPTTDIQGVGGFNYNTIDPASPAYSDYPNKDYTGKFSGTSAACPHVAGVAALILSTNPNLTYTQVKTIIEQTAQKIGDYEYQPTAGRQNGTWHTEVGYGLVNAEAAVYAASLMFYEPCPPVTNISTLDNHGGSVTFRALPNLPPLYGDYLWETSPSAPLLSQDRNVATFALNPNTNYTISCATYNENYGDNLTPNFFNMYYAGNSYQVASPPSKQVTVTLGNNAAAAPQFASSASSSAVGVAASTISYSLINQTTGATVATGQMPAAGGTLNFSAIPSGIYVLLLETSSGATESHKIIL